MDFEDSPQEAAFRAEVRTFLEAHASPKTGTDADWSRGGMSTDPDEIAVYLERCRSWQRTLYDNGWAGITWPKEFGGRGGTPSESIIFNQEALLFDVTTGFIGAAQQLVGPPILHFGTDEQKKRYIPPMLRGEEMWCQLFSEPGAGSDLSTLATRAVLDGDEFVVTGQKVWTSEAQHADYGILLTRTDPSVPKHKGITFFVVDMRSPGVDIRPLVQATGLSHFNEVFLSDVRIPAENVIGEVNGGWAPARATLASEAGMIGGSGLSSQFVAVLALARECERTDDPLVRQVLADVYTRERILKFHGMRMQTAVMHKKGIPPDPSVLKNFFVQSLTQRVNLALTIEGTAGMLADGDAIQDGFWQKQCMAQFSSRIGGGTSEVHKNMIGERALGLPRGTAERQGRPLEGLAQIVTDADDRFAYGIADGDEATAAERERLSHLASLFDRGSIKLITSVGIASGWHCLEVGAGHGGLARWLAESVGDDGRVMATDIDTRFLVDMPANVIVREHDIASDPLPAEHFDLVHARAVLQHVPEREHALERMIDAAKPGGWLVIEDIDWLVFDSQELPEPFATLHHTVRTAYTANAGYDGEWGRRMLPTMRGSGLLDVESRGTVTTMHGGTPSAEWYVMALERAGPALVGAGMLEQGVVDAAIAEAREPDFAVLSPLSISAWGRKPG